MHSRLGPSMQMRHPQDNRFYSLQGDLAHNADRIARDFMESVTGSFAQKLCRKFHTTTDELIAGFAILVNALRLRQVKPAYSMKHCFFEVGWLNLREDIRFATAALYGQAVMFIAGERVAEARITRDIKSGMPGSSPIDDAFRGETFDLAAALLEVAPDGIKAPIDLDQQY